MSANVKVCLFQIGYCDSISLCFISGRTFYRMKCFYFCVPFTYIGFIWMLSAVSHSFGNVLFFLGLAITGI